MPTIISGDTGIDKIAAGAIEKADLPTGSVLQVVQVTKTDVATTTSSSFSDVMSLNITPISSSSKILLMANFFTGGGQGSNYPTPAFIFRRGTTELLKGDASGSRTSAHAGGHLTATGSSNGYWCVPVSMSYIDSPSTTSQVTYNLSWAEKNQGGGNVAIFNVSAYDYSGNDASWLVRSASTFIAMEIAS